MIPTAPTLRNPLRPAPVLAMALCLALAPASRAVDASWSSFRGDSGTGVAADPLPPGDGPLALELAWKRPLGSGYSGVSVAEGLLVTAFQAGERDVVAAFDPADGAEHWRHDLGPTYRGHDGSHDGPIATPAIAGGRVYMVGATGRFVALDAATGEAVWTVDLVEDLGCEAPYYGFAGSPVVAGDTVVLQIPGEGGAVAGFDAATGTLRWRSVEDGAMAQTPIVAEVAGRRQVLAMTSARVSGIDPADGTVLWSFEHEGAPGPFGAWTSSPLPIGGDRLFLKHEDPSSSVVAVTAGDEGLAAARLATSRAMTRTYSPATVAGGTVYGFTARFLSAVDPATGETLWRSRAVGDGFVIAVDDHLVALEKTGGLHLGPASPEGWSEAAALELFADHLAWTPPSYAAGAVYARSLGELARVDVVRGRERRASSGDAAPPAALAPLVEAIAAGSEPAAAVEAFLAGRELPIVGEAGVTFLWRGEAGDVAIAGDMIGMRREEPMRRLPGTDLWWWHTELDPRARVSYLFFVDYQPSLDPAHGRTATATVLGPDMNWNRGEPMEMSWLAMPEWPGLAAADGMEAQMGAAMSAATSKAPKPASGSADGAPGESAAPEAAATAEAGMPAPGSADGAPGEPVAPEAATARRGGRLETFEVVVERSVDEGEEPLEPLPVPVHAWLPPGYDDGDARYPVVYVRHGAARAAGGWIETLDRVVGDTVRPLIAVFPEIPRARGMRGAFAEQIVPAVDARYRTVAAPEGRANVGMGWPGYQAAMDTFRNTELFGVLGVQSLFLLDENMKRLEAAIGEATAETHPMRIYLEWGRWDLVSPHEGMNFRASSRWGWDLLRRKGWQPLGGEVWDSTDFASWRNRTEVMLEALFPAEGGASDFGRWFTGAP